MRSYILITKIAVVSQIN